MTHEIHILGTGIGQMDPTSSQDPRLRKATRNMLLALSACTEALGDFKPDPSQLGFVLGSSHGELEMTLSFLKTLAQTEVARPLLFQNSLHNSTSGFVAMTHKVFGPMITVSNLHFSGEDALDTACTLLADDQCEYCLVVGVDVRLPDLGPELELGHMNREARRDGAAAVLLTTARAGEKRRPSLGRLIGTKRSWDSTSTWHETTPHYDSDAIEHLVHQVRGRKESPKSRLHLPKPDGSTTTILWQP